MTSSNAQLETRFLLHCAGAPAGEDAAREPGFDWERLLRLASAHKLVPRVARTLEGLPGHRCPPALHNRLRRYANGSAQRGRVLAGELLTILDLFERAGIRAIAFKGPVWAAALHGDVGLRQFSDLDLLVGEGDSARARDVLLAEGFRITVRRPPIVFRDCMLASADGVVNLDLHWGFTRTSMGTPFTFEELWARRTRVTIEGRAVDHFLPEHLFLILAMYAGKELPWLYLTYLADIAALLRGGEGIDVDGALEEAGRRGIRRLALFTLHLLADLGLAPQHQQPGASPDRAFESIAAAVRRQMFEEPGGLIDMTPSDTVKAMTHVRLRERLADKVRPIAYLPFYMPVLRPLRAAGMRTLAAFSGRWQPPAGLERREGGRTSP